MLKIKKSVSKNDFSKSIKFWIFRISKFGFPESRKLDFEKLQTFDFQNWIFQKSEFWILKNCKTLILDFGFFLNSNTPNPYVQPSKSVIGFSMRASHLRMWKCSDFSSKPTLLFLVKMDHPERPDIGFRIFSWVWDPKSPRRVRETRCRGLHARQPPPDVEIRVCWTKIRTRFSGKCTTPNGQISDFVFFLGSSTPSPYPEPDRSGAGLPTRASHLSM